MARKCSTCQHVKRAEIDRRLAAGEPGNQIASDYDLNPSSLHRHRANCLGPSSTNTIMNVVRHEIFGPILPIRLYDQPQEVVDAINASDRPLAVYPFTNNARTRDFLFRG